MTEPVKQTEEEKHPFFRDDFNPDDYLSWIGSPLGGEKPDMTGEPLWKRIWFKILRIT